MAIWDKLRNELIDIIEWLDDTRDTMVWRFPRSDNEIKYGAKLIVLVPPTPASEDAVHHMTLASRRAGVETLVPVDPAVLSVHYYQPDNLHLNSEGAAIFTVALATYLPRQLLSRESIGSPQ